MPFRNAIPAWGATLMARTILCYGDSNTHGTPPMPDLDRKDRFGRDERWPTLMAKALGQDWIVIEEGQPGRTTLHDDPVEGAHRNGLTILPAVLESHRPINLVILKLGTNDLKPRFSVHAPDIAMSLGRLIDVIRASASGPAGGAPQILLVAPPPILETGCLAEIFQGGAAISARLGAACRKIAAHRNVAFLDAGEHIAVSTLDGIHYDAAAHATLAKAITVAVRHHFA
jgi:lysophospholipase L1-like esterase